MGGIKGLTAGPGAALQHVLQRVRDLPDPLVQVGGGVLEQRPGEGPEGCMVVGWEKSIPTTSCLTTAPGREGGQKYPPQRDGGAGSGLHQCGFLL